MVLTTAILVSQASGDADEFSKFPAGAVETKDHAEPRLRGNWDLQNRDALLYAADGDVNFAGHYVLAEIGCGAGCIMVAAIDAKTGTITRFPATISNWPKPITEPLAYRPTSRLLVVHGQLDEKGSSGPRRFVFDGRGFAPL